MCHVQVCCAIGGGECCTFGVLRTICVQVEGGASRSGEFLCTLKEFLHTTYSGEVWIRPVRHVASNTLNLLCSTHLWPTHDLWPALRMTCCGFFPCRYLPLQIGTL
jgi:hypothetical protein